MYRKLKIKILKYRKNLFYVVVALNKKSIRSHYIDKLGVCFFRKNKKIIMFSLKKLSFWLNKGVQISSLISYLVSIIFSYYIHNTKINDIYNFSDQMLKNNIVLKKNIIKNNSNFNNFLKNNVIFTKKK